MNEVDPWLTEEIDKGTRCTSEVFCSSVFEDNFITITKSKNQKLPDSAEYIANLEKKLAKIKSGTSSSRSEQQQLIHSLEQTHKSYMCRLIAGDINCVSNQDLALDEPTNLSTNWLRNQVNPEQALTVGELVELLKADYLAKENTDNQEVSDVTESS